MSCPVVSNSHYDTVRLVIDLLPTIKTDHLDMSRGSRSDMGQLHFHLFISHGPDPYQSTRHNAVMDCYGLVTDSIIHNKSVSCRAVNR